MFCLFSYKKSFLIICNMDKQHEYFQIVSELYLEYKIVIITSV